MRDVNITWDLPTTRESGGELLVSEIQHVEVLISADLGASFTLLNEVPPANRSLVVPDLEIGDWQFQLTVVDTGGRRSQAVLAAVNVPDETNPSGVLNVVVTLVTI